MTADKHSEPASHQTILFGPPGTSKSYRARHVLAKGLGAGGDDLVQVTFHPEYSYGDFVARLLPITNGEKKVEYQVHAGPFLRALAKALVHKGQNVVLLIDEINRGNCAEIFGDVFQLLDREGNGESSYRISASDLVLAALQREVGHLQAAIPSSPNAEKPAQEGQEKAAQGQEGTAQIPNLLAAILAKREISLPANLYLIGTMNTSDESVYYMDSAFKRRWHFDYCAADDWAGVPYWQRCANVNYEGEPKITWEQFVGAVNRFIVNKSNRFDLDDKLIGPWFIKATPQGIDIPEGGALSCLFGDGKSEEEIGGGLQGNRKYDLTNAGRHPLYDPSIWSELDFELNSSVAKKKFTSWCGKYLDEAFMADDFDALIGRYHDIMERYDRVMGANAHLLSQVARHVFVDQYKLMVSKVTCRDWFDGHLKELCFDEFNLASKIEAFNALPRIISLPSINGKLMHYLWDNVFDRDRGPLSELLGLNLRTFGDFQKKADLLIEKLINKYAGAQPVNAPNIS